MKYLCLAYIDEKRMAALSEQEYDALRKEGLAHIGQLREQGHYVAFSALERVDSARTIRRTANGNLSITDGPFAETKEQLGGFVLIDAKDIFEATEIASKMPVGRLGCIEIRLTKDIGDA